MRVAGERPKPADSASIAMAEPERDRVAEYRTDNRPREHRPIRQGPGRHQGSRYDEYRGPREQQADKGERLAEGCNEHHWERPARIGGDEVEGRLDEMFHALIL